MARIGDPGRSYLAAFAVLAASLKRTGGGSWDLIWFAAVMAGCAALVLGFWRFAVSDHGMLLRQSWAILLAPFPILGAALLNRAAMPCE